MEDVGNAVGVAMLFGLIALIVMFVFFNEPSSPWPDTSEGAVVTITEHEYQTSQGTMGGGVNVAILDSFWASLSELATQLCAGGCTVWLVLLLIAVGGIAGLASR